jgi:hypothetical protein
MCGTIYSIKEAIFITGTGTGTGTNDMVPIPVLFGSK